MLFHMLFDSLHVVHIECYCQKITMYQSFYQQQDYKVSGLTGHKIVY